MAIKNILVAFDGTEGARAALTLGLRMADKYDAHLTGLMPHGTPSARLNRLIASHSSLGEAIAEIDARAIAEAEEMFRVATDGRDNAHWTTTEASADAAIVENARYFDVTLVGQYNRDREDSSFAMHPDVIALQSGRPIIIVPKGHDRALGERAVVAWDGQRAAARALSDAMQILETKELVTILTVSGGAPEEGHPGERLEQQLSRHSIATNWVNLETKGRSIGDAIVGWCKENSPDLLVMGAYEHSKFREDLVGGVTNSVLKNAPAPVLLAH